MNELLVLGILISLIFGEVTGLSPGGIIVPAYFAMYIYSPLRIFSTLLMAFLSWGIVTLLSNHMILYGRRRFAMYLLVGIFLKTGFSLLYYHNIFDFVNLSASIGYVVPGLLGRDMEKQGPVKTLLSLSIATLIILIIRAICFA